MTFPCVRSEGGLLPQDILEQIAAGEVNGQQPTDFGLEKTRRLNDEIAAAWQRAQSYWKALQSTLDAVPVGDPATTATREQWLLPLLRWCLDYEATYMPSAAVVDGQTFAVSHRAGMGESSSPVHLVGFRTDLSEKPPSGRPRLSAHALVQEYLNRTEHLWGAVSNGRTLRLLRDASRMSRPSYLEFDLEQMMAGEKFSDFTLLYRIQHRTRLPKSLDDAPQCLLEHYYQQGIEQGGRVREHLRDGVEEVLRLVGQGLLDHPANEEFRIKIRSRTLTPEEFYRQLLRMVYRLLFLMVGEDRNLIVLPQSQRRATHEKHYSISRLRDVSARPFSVTLRHSDLWQGILVLFRLFEDNRAGEALGLSPLNGDLFGEHAMPALEGTVLGNDVTLQALRHLTFYAEKGTTRRINYAALDVEELGSVYESLLDFHPAVSESNGKLQFDLIFGTERKSTGSYYTRPELVAELIKSALGPVIDDKLAAEKTPDDKAKALLSLKVCDPACGSGHFLLAAARRIGRELARLRTGEDEPAPEAFRLAVREVLQHCVYGVDLNPLAVDLCKLALWLEGHSTGKPLSFLDHRIRCGNSLVGVFSLDVLRQGIPDDAYKPVAGDDKKAASAIRKRNKQEREAGRIMNLDFGQPVDPTGDLPLFAGASHSLDEMADDTPAAVKRKAEAYEHARRNDTWWRDKTGCDTWTAAFFVQLADSSDPAIPTSGRLWAYLERPKATDGRLLGKAGGLAAENRFFHWPLEFPEVLAQGGFDCVLGNPPWERIKLQEQEFFASRDTAIAQAPNKAARQRLIYALRADNPVLADEFERTKHEHEAQSKCVRAGGRFLLTAVGDVNTYALFAELARTMLGPLGRAGILVPAGIATDDTTSAFFADNLSKKTLVSYLGMDNEAQIFPSIDHRNKFCLLTLSGPAVDTDSPEFTYACSKVEYLELPARRYQLPASDFALLNPNTRTCPTFRTRVDAELARAIYQRVPVLERETPASSPWGVSFMRMFDMANDSGLFQTREQLIQGGFRLSASVFVKGDECYLPLYEAKMVWHYDHRYGSYESRGGERGFSSLPNPTSEQYADPDYAPAPFYWVSELETLRRLSGLTTEELAELSEKPLTEQLMALRGCCPPYLLGFRDVTSSVVERTGVFAMIPRAAVGHTMPLMQCAGTETKRVCGLTGNLDSMAFDWLARQKLAATHMTYFILKQLPVLPPDRYSHSDLDFIVPRVLELTYTAWDMRPFAEDMGYKGPPFKWDEDRRVTLRAELDAYYAKLYGLTRKQLRYILDPHSLTDHELEDILDPTEDPPDVPRTKDFPGETFRVLKEKEIKQFGEYRTQRLVLAAWDRLFG